ncbi:MAG TPA: 2Fe-2S iron-sulfur cluster-binding protein, partial [Marinagarivorans sp.]|nr:2Fe-2S iron-sulfur cluster-binding protein [Marinagarivorans sp.]
TLGYADFRGNRQYISVGNLNADERISLIFMDYAHQRRLKIWGRAKIVHESEQPELIASLEDPHYRARIERAVVIHVEAYEWNCPQHIAPRFTEDEVRATLAPLLAENAQLKSQIASGSEKITAMGQGELALVVTGIRQLTPRIRAYELRSAAGVDLPAIEPGAHLKVPILMADGSTELRHYSICSNPARRDVYEIAVLKNGQGRGASQRLHEVVALGMTLNCAAPENYFPLQNTSEPVILIAGGIGITAIKPMAQYLAARAVPFELHYTGRSPEHMAFCERLRRELGGRFFAYYSAAGNRLEVEKILQKVIDRGAIYVCGPQRLIDAVYASAEILGVDTGRIFQEQFSLINKQEKPFSLRLARSEKTLAVSGSQSVLEALESVGISPAFDCRVGNCGQCAVKVLAGDVEHRDRVLSDADKNDGLMCACVSRPHGDTLVLDI